MNCGFSKTRLLLAALFAPVAMTGILFFIYFFGGYFSTGSHDMRSYLLLLLQASGPFWIMTYAGLVLLLPYCLLLHRLHKLRLAFFLPGSYFVGAVVLVFSYPYLIHQPLDASAILMIIPGGAYGFFQGILFWYMAGLHCLRKEYQHATAH